MSPTTTFPASGCPPRSTVVTGIVRCPVAASLRADRDADGRLTDEIHRALREHGDPALRNIEVAVHKGRVTLFGCVPTYYLKQLTQTTARQLSGVTAVQNKIDVMHSILPTKSLYLAERQNCSQT